MDTKKLRQKILDLAIRGKLVPQDPNDEPASVLLERIRTEKERLIKEGKIKRSKKSASDTPHYENLPFEVPESWEWTTIEDVTINRDSERIPLSLADRKKQQDKVYDYYGAAGVIDKVENYLFDERLLLVGEDGANLLSRSKDNAFFAEGKYWVNNHAHVLDCPRKSVLDYVAFVINSMSLEDYITGSAQPKLTQDNLNKILIPLPPEKEQHRIIESVNDYFSFISLLEGEIDEMNSFVQKAKSKILDLAIHGKLVPQDPNDEPAIELLKRINPSFVPCDNAHYENVPFEIPKSWRWTCMAEVNEYNSASVDPSKSPNNDFELYSVPAYETGMPEFVKGKDISSSKKSVSKNDVLLCKINPHLNRAWIVSHYKENMPCLASSEWIIFRNSSIIPQYLSFCFTSKYFKELMLSNVSGVGGSLMRAQPAIVNKYLFPLPPINEQCRIVAAIQEYYEILDNMSANL